MRSIAHAFNFISTAVFHEQHYQMSSENRNILTLHQMDIQSHQGML